MAKKNTAAAAVAEVEQQLEIEIPAAARKPSIKAVPRSYIHPDPDQPRVDADAELRASIARNGILQPITVRPHPDPALRGDAHYMIVDGERRWRGSEGILDELPVILRRDLDGYQLLTTQGVANSGKPLTPLEEARMYARAMELLGEDATIDRVARDFGQPRSSVAERLSLLDIGRPWLELLTAGKITVSQAVKLIPLAGVPEEFHEEAIAAVRKDYRWTNHGRGEGDLSVADFERLVLSYYERFMYPLKKSGGSYAKQPKFDTSRHDDECACGGVKFALGHVDQKRACCGNPSWWRPQHRKAVAAKRPKTAGPKHSTSAGGTPKRVALYLPEGASTARGASPKGVALLTDTTGRWIGSFDPVNMLFDESKLVRVVTADGERVGTSDAADIQAACERWASRWEQRRQELQAERAARIEGARSAFGVAGTGLCQLIGVLGAYAWDFAGDVMEFEEAAKLIGAKPPKNQRFGREQLQSFAAWATKDLSGEQREHLAAILLLSTADESICTPVDELLQEEREKAEAAIRTTLSPWAKKRVGYTDGSGAPTPTKPVTKKAPAKKAARRAPEPDFMRPYQPSPELGAVVGAQPQPRTEVTKKLWDYIRKQGLQDGKNRRQINADDKLRPVFGGKQSISMFEMTKAINKHLTEVRP